MKPTIDTLPFEGATPELIEAIERLIAQRDDAIGHLRKVCTAFAIEAFGVSSEVVDDALRWLDDEAKVRS